MYSSSTCSSSFPRLKVLFGHLNLSGINGIKQSNYSINRQLNFSSTSNNSNVEYINGLPSSYDPSKSTQDKLLFTPGPLTTSFPTKLAMMKDLGSRDSAFIQVVKQVRQGLLDIAQVDNKEYTTIPIQGSGTFGVESTICTVVDKKRGLFVIANGSYGDRIVKIAKVHKIPVVVYELADDTQPDLTKINEYLQSSASSVSHVAVVHSETTSGIINNIEEIGKVAAKHKKQFIVDSMSAFGAVPIDFKAANIDYLVSSSNKCIEGTPGFSFIIAKKSSLNECKGNSSSLALDCYAQWVGLEENGQFRFTPPTHPLLAFHQAMKELQLEGGVKARAARYKENQRILSVGMKSLGFELYLKPENQGYIISGYHYPKDKNWNFQQFYSQLNDRGFVIYPGKVSKADCFRIGHIGRIFPKDTKNLLVAIEEVCKEMKTAKFAQ